MKAKTVRKLRARWVRLWVSTSRQGFAEDYYRTSEPADELKERAERFADNHFGHSDAFIRYGWDVVKRPPKKWLREKLDAQAQHITDTQAYIRELARWLR